jgi:glycosyltransferase involved in cell wall biosynthesis/Tfp pilus assembly protein PilF
MARRYLFGPVTAPFADDHLAGPRQRGECLTFGRSGTDVCIGLDDSWEEIRRRLPAGWQPDFLALVLAYTSIAEALWHAPLPRIGLAADVNLLWHGYQFVLSDCDLLLTDTVSVERMHCAGFAQAVPANLYGLGQSFLGLPPSSAERDIDVLFVGNVQGAVQRERLSWLGRLAALGKRWTVRLHTGVFGAEYRSLLQRARIVFNRSARHECNMRAFEATAAGALLFQEADNREVPEYFTPGQEYVAYTDENLEALLEHHLTHEDERRGIAEAGCRRAQAYDYESLWKAALERVEEAWPQIQHRLLTAAEDHASSASTPALLGDARDDTDRSLMRRLWQALSAGALEDTALPAALEGALALAPFSVPVRNALGLVGTLARQQGGPLTPAIAHVAARYFHRALQDDPDQVMVALNLIEALVGMGHGRQAAALAQRALTLLHRPLRPEELLTPHFPPCFDLFRVEWERSGWDHGGQPEAEQAAKRDLLRWRLHALLADLTGHLHHFEDAVRLRPDLPITQAALGCAYARGGQLDRAEPPLRAALVANPFDLQAARALFQVQGDSSDRDGQDRLAAQRRLLARAAPQVVPAEPWFVEANAPTNSLPASVAVPQNGLAVERTGPTALVWEGDQLKIHSLAHVNRHICQHLLTRGHELMLLPGVDETESPATPAAWHALANRIQRPLSRPADIHVRHQWPPNFQPPSEGRWVLMQPWEFGSLPKAWIEPILRQVDEVWVPSRFVRDSFLQSGVPGDLVHVIPLGADPEHFRPDIPPLPLTTRKRFRFLFVGGTLWRKGIDVLLDAYTRAFNCGDDVCLVIKDMGVGTFYRGQTAEERIAEIQAAAAAPEIVYLNRELSDEELAGLYTACDCLVHPYRGEGFGLPIVEAMAAGLPVVVTGLGAALDYCDAANAYLVPAAVRRFAEKRVGELETVDYPSLAEPEPPALVESLQHILSHPEEAKAKGQAGRARVVAKLTWEHTVRAIEQRIEVLRYRPPRRTQTWITRPVSRTDSLVGGAVAQAGRTEVGEAVPAPVIAGARTPRVALTMIVRNEEANLSACLDSVADLVDEIVIVDTGSADRTKDIAAGYGAKLFDFPWCDSFAAARNEALRHTTSPWILWLDADDRLDEPNRAKLRALLARLGDENAAYSLKCFCLPEGRRDDATVVDHIRLFRNHPAIRWEHRVHEQILPGVRRVGGEVRFADVVIQHTGYCDPALRQRKLDRDRRLVELELAEQPNHPFTLFNLGSILQEQGRHAEALEALRRSLALSHPSDSIVRKLYGLIAGCHRLLGQLSDALAACQEGRRHYPDDPELLYREGVLHTEQGDLLGAASCLEQLLHSEPPPYFASVSVALRGYQGRHVLADVYRRLGRWEEAERQWRHVVAEQPKFLPGWLGLADLHLGAGHWEEFGQVLHRLDADTQAALEVAVLWARGHMARKEFDPAQRLLHEAIGRWPRAMWPRVILSHALLQEGKDLEAAEEALRDVLVLDPGHHEARHNLALLLEQQNRASDGFLSGGKSLSDLYHAACTTPSDVHAHLPRLYELASHCRHITLFGTRLGTIATALLYAQPETLICYDKVRTAHLDRLRALAGKTLFRFRQADVRQTAIEATDFLVLDTRHDYAQLHDELRLHAAKVRRYLAIVGTARYAERGESAGDQGLGPAVAEFLEQGRFRLLEQHKDKHGLTVLEAVSRAANEPDGAVGPGQEPL